MNISLWIRNTIKFVQCQASPGYSWTSKNAFVEYKYTSVDIRNATKSFKIKPLLSIIIHGQASPGHHSKSAFEKMFEHFIKIVKTR